MKKINLKTKRFIVLSIIMAVVLAVLASSIISRKLKAEPNDGNESVTTETTTEFEGISVVTDPEPKFEELPPAPVDEPVDENDGLHHYVNYESEPIFTAEEKHVLVDAAFDDSEE